MNNNNSNSIGKMFDSQENELDNVSVSDSLGSDNNEEESSDDGNNFDFNNLKHEYKK